MLTPRCKRRLVGVHPDLVRVINRAARDWKDPSLRFIVTEGVRTVARQREFVAAGLSRTMRSRHLKAPNGFAHAVDFAGVVGKTVRFDWPAMIRWANAMKAAAIAEGIVVEWGGFWKPLNTVKGPITAAMLSKTFPDGPHFELPWETHPGTTKEK